MLSVIQVVFTSPVILLLIKVTFQFYLYQFHNLALGRLSWTIEESVPCLAFLLTSLIKLSSL